MTPSYCAPVQAGPIPKLHQATSLLSGQGCQLCQQVPGSTVKEGVSEGGSGIVLGSGSGKEKGIAVEFCTCFQTLSLSV